MAEMDSFSLCWTWRESWWKIERQVVWANKLMKWMDIYAHTRAVNILILCGLNQIGFQFKSCQYINLFYVVWNKLVPETAQLLIWKDWDHVG